MASNYTEEQLKNLDKETIIRLFLAQKEQLENLDHTLQLVLEQLADLKRHRFGRSTERHETDGQILFMEIDGNIVFFNKLKKSSVVYGMIVYIMEMNDVGHIFFLFFSPKTQTFCKISENSSYCSCQGAGFGL